jgi:protein TonB
MNITGKVVVRFLVMPDGRVQNAKVLESAPDGVFDRCVLESVGQWRFRPGYYQNKAVATWVVVPVRFKLTKD